MYVNAFWFGFLMAIVVLLSVTIILALMAGHRSDRDEEEIQRMLEREIGELDGRPGKLVKTGSGVFRFVPDEDSGEKTDEKEE